MILQVGELPVASSFSSWQVLPEPWAELWMAPPRVSRPKMFGENVGELKLLYTYPRYPPKNHTKHNTKFFFGDAI